MRGYRGLPRGAPSCRLQTHRHHANAGPSGGGRPRALCQRIFSVFADGQLPDFEALFHPEAVNREASTQPSACRARGPAAFYVTGLWLRSALTDMHWDIHE